MSVICLAARLVFEQYLKQAQCTLSHCISWLSIMHRRSGRTHFGHSHLVILKWDLKKCTRSFGPLIFPLAGTQWNETILITQNVFMELFSRRRWRLVSAQLCNCETNLVIALYTPSLLFCKFINTTAYHLGRYEPSSPKLLCSLVYF